MLTKPAREVTALEPPASVETSKETNTRTPPSSRESTLPAAPFVTIQSSGSVSPLNLRELWSYRELLYFLIWRDVKVRYKQTALGIAWAVLQPLLMMAVFALFFSRIANIQVGSIPYPLFAFAGLVPWTFFSTAVTLSGNSLVGSAHLITKVYFPRVLVPTGAVTACLVDFALAFAVLVPMLAYYGVRPGRGLLMLPVLVLLMFCFALGVGMWFSSLNVKYRDVRFVLPFLIQLWLFASSVILPPSAMPARFRWILKLNPMSAIVEGFRAALFGLPFQWRDLGFAAVIAIAALAYAAHSFRRTERGFADII